MKTVRIVMCAVLVVMFLSFQAQDVKAYDFDYNIGDPTSNAFDPSSLSNFLDENSAAYTAYTGGFSGTYLATFIGYRAAHVNTFTAPGTGNFFITNPDAASGSHSTAGDFFNIAGTTAYFDDTNDGPTGITLNSAQYLMSYVLTQNWTYTGNSGITLNFLQGDIIVGFGDDAGDQDYLDLVVGLRDVNQEVPIPAAIWLLGSGLLGLIGVRRRKKL